MADDAQVGVDLVGTTEAAVARRLPRRCTAWSAWHEHIPFAMYAVAAFRPRVLVELGTQGGDSYCAFCQAVLESELVTRCYAVDTWEGDPHTGPYGPEVLQDLRRHHDPLYGGFSRLLQSTFDNAANFFESDEIDLLHIDGYHTYEAVSHDFATWLPKLSDRGIVLLHDTNVREKDFGVWRFWAEAQARFPHFEFTHGHGLGLVLVGKRPPRAARRLASLSAANAMIVRGFFSSLGQRVALLAKRDVLEKRVTELEGHRAELERALGERRAQVEGLEAAVAARDARMTELEGQRGELERALGERRAQVEGLRDDSLRLQRQLTEVNTVVATHDQIVSDLKAQLAMAQRNVAIVQASEAWKIGLTFSRIGGCVFPQGSMQRRILGLGVRALSVARREGAGVLCRRLMVSLRTITHSFRANPGSQFDQPDSHTAGLHYSLDAASVDRRQIYGWGWAFHQDRDIQTIELAMGTGPVCTLLPCQYGKHRADVAAAYPSYPAAAYSGFVIAGVISHKRPTTLSLRIVFSDGHVTRVPISPSIVRWNASAIQPAVRANVPSLVRWVAQRGLDSLHRFRRVGFSGLIPRTRPHVTESGASLAEVQVFDARRLARAVRATKAPCTLVIDHNLGGGANYFRDKYLRECSQSGNSVLLLYYDVPTQVYHVRYMHGDEGETLRLWSLEGLVEFASLAPLAEIFLNTTYSFRDPLAVAQCLSKLKAISKAELTVAIHDYFCVCPSFTLIDHRGEFCGIPDDLRICDECLRKNRADWLSLVESRDIRAWRRTWEQFLREASRILCFSHSSVDLLLRAYPGLDPRKIVVKPHVVDYLTRDAIEVKLDAPLNIGIVGAIEEYKGASIVREMARLATERRLPVTITVIGTMDCPPNTVLRVTGQYERARLGEAIEDSRANIFFIPSVWPETFSFVCGELMHLGVPVAVFDLGAPAERVRSYRNGLVISEISAVAALEALVRWHDELRKREQTAMRLRPAGVGPEDAQ